MKNFLNNLISSGEQSQVEVIEPQNHDWQLVETFYAAPRKDLVQFETLDRSTIEKAMFGVTTLIFQSQITKEIRKEEILGSPENVLEALFDKAERFGPQNVKSDITGRVFVVSKYLPPQSLNPLDLPLKNPNA